MRWSRRTIVIGASAAAVATGLAVALVIVLPGRGTPLGPARPGPSRSSALTARLTPSDGHGPARTAAPRSPPRPAR